MIDVAIIETGSGGDLIYRTPDLQPARGLENQPYGLMFGGNASEPWWGNDLLMPNTPFTCLTQDALRNNPLTSQGRVNIEAAMNADLQTLRDNIPGTTATVSTSITAPNRLEAEININGQIFIALWNPDAEFLTYTLR